MTSGNRREHTIIFSLIATKHQDILYSEKLKIDKLIFDILSGSTRTDQMRYHRNAVTLLNGSSNGNGTGAATYSQTLILSIVCLTIDILGMMCSDIDKIGSIPFNLSIVRKRASVPLPFKGGSTSKENLRWPVCCLSISITFIVYSFAIHFITL